MNEESPQRMVPEAPRSVSQKLGLVCEKCGRRHSYDVGAIYVWEKEAGEADRQIKFSFGNYFHCRDCGSAGPWKVANQIQLLGLTLPAALGRSDERVIYGKPVLFDGTTHQTPAMAEEHLLRLIAQAPQDAFLHTRLGNLLRICGRRAEAARWYAKALERDEGDLEARYHLFWFAAQDGETSTMVDHAEELVRFLLEGRKTKTDELTQNIARSVVERLRAMPEDIAGEFLPARGGAVELPEWRFIRRLRAEEGDEESIILGATKRLLQGDAGPKPPPLTVVVASMVEQEGAGPPLEPIAPLRELVEQEGLDVRKLTVAVAEDEKGHARVPDRRSVLLFDGKHGAVWTVGSLRELMRGGAKPPPDMDQYPKAYSRAIFCLEKPLLSLCNVDGDRTDQELETIFSALRRRPDGKSHLGAVQDVLWQGAALMLGLHALSQAEYEAIVGLQERWVRSWAQRPVSRNYVRSLRERTE